MAVTVKSAREIELMTEAGIRKDNQTGYKYMGNK